MDLKREEYEQKRIEIINKFSKGFIDEKYNRNAILMTSIDLLIRDINPYVIIEHLINTQEQLIQQLDKLADISPIRPIIVDKLPPNPHEVIKKKNH